MGVSYCGVIVADLVPASCGAEAIEGGISVSAGGDAICLGLCGLALGTARFSSSV